MQNFQDPFEILKQSFINAFVICMTVPLIHNGGDKNVGSYILTNASSTGIYYPNFLIGFYFCMVNDFHPRLLT